MSELARSEQERVLRPRDKVSRSVFLGLYIGDIPPAEFSEKGLFFREVNNFLIDIDGSIETGGVFEAFGDAPGSFLFLGEYVRKSGNVLVAVVDVSGNPFLYKYVSGSNTWQVVGALKAFTGNTSLLNFKEKLFVINNGNFKSWNGQDLQEQVTLSATGYVPCDPADIGKMVKDDGVDTGVLLAYNNTDRIWTIQHFPGKILSGSALTIALGVGAGTASADSKDINFEDVTYAVAATGTLTADPEDDVPKNGRSTLRTDKADWITDMYVDRRLRFTSGSAQDSYYRITNTIKKKSGAYAKLVVDGNPYKDGARNLDNFEVEPSPDVPFAEVATIYQERIYLGNLKYDAGAGLLSYPNRISWCAVRDETRWNTLSDQVNYIEFSSPVVGFGVISDSLIVVCENSVEILQGSTGVMQDAAYYYPVKKILSKDRGGNFHRGVYQGLGDVIFIGRTRICSVGAVEKYGDLDAVNLSLFIEKGNYFVDQSDATVDVTYWEERDEFWILCGSQILILKMLSGIACWTRIDLGSIFNCIYSNNFGEVYIGGATGARRFNRGADNCNAYFLSHLILDEQNLLNLKKSFIRFDLPFGQRQASVKTFVDVGDGFIYKQMSRDIAAVTDYLIWDTDGSLWDNQLWSGDDIDKRIFNLIYFIGKTGRRVKYSLTLAGQGVCGVRHLGSYFVPTRRV